jgi:putative membrane protein
MCKMLVDYLTLMLVSMTAGLFLLAYYVYRGIGAENTKWWVPGFAMTGFIAVTTGLHMSFTWPLTGSYNIAFGEMSVLLGILFLGAALALWKGWEMRTVSIYAFFAGLAAVVVGARVISLGMTKSPVVSGIGFILTGLGGLFAWLCCLAEPILGLGTNRILRAIGALVLIAAAVIWAFTGYLAYWEHLESFSKWVPLTMR